MLYRETGLETLESRHKNHKLYLFYKTYLSSLIPPLVENTTVYGLRNATNIRQTLSRTQLYYNSFLPSCIRAWNVLNVNVNSLAIFKNRINENAIKPLNIISLMKDLFRFNKLDSELHAVHSVIISSEKNIVNDPNYTCGTTETTRH